MKKIMFNDKYGLTQAVLDGRKTMTRRIIKYPSTFKGQWVAGFNIHRSHSDKKIIGYPCMYDADEREFDMGEILPKYKAGEVVAIAQPYKDIADEFRAHQCIQLIKHPGWNNKVFVRADLMPHHIRITNVKTERLQAISDIDCMAEGINYYEQEGFSWCTTGNLFNTTREAFAALIDKVSGKGVFQSNPYVFVYEFELVD